jgi:hypothetical protein
MKRGWQAVIRLATWAGVTELEREVLQCLEIDDNWGDPKCVEGRPFRDILGYLRGGSQVSKRQLSDCLASLLTRDLITKEGDDYSLSRSAIAKMEGLIPVLDSEAAKRRSVREQEYARKWRAIAERQGGRCNGCGMSLPAGPIIGPDGSGNRAILPPRIHSRELGPVILCRTCANIANGKSEDEFRANLKLRQAISSARQSRASLLTETEAAHFFRITPTRIRLLMASGLNAEVIGGTVFVDRVEVEEALRL